MSTTAKLSFVISGLKERIFLDISIRSSKSVKFVSVKMRNSLLDLTYTLQCASKKFCFAVPSVMIINSQYKLYIYYKNDNKL